MSTDEREVWVRAICAALSRGQYSLEVEAILALGDAVLNEFRAKFDRPESYRQNARPV